MCHQKYILNHSDSMMVLDANELNAVSGGWCGTPYPGSWEFLRCPIQILGQVFLTASSR